MTGSPGDGSDGQGTFSAWGVPGGWRWTVPGVVRVCTGAMQSIKSSRCGGLGKNRPLRRPQGRNPKPSTSECRRGERADGQAYSHRSTGVPCSAYGLDRCRLSSALLMGSALHQAANSSWRRAGVRSGAWAISPGSFVSSPLSRRACGARGRCPGRLRGQPHAPDAIRGMPP